MEINGRRLINNNDRIGHNQSQLKIKYINKDNNYRLIYNKKYYNLNKENNYLTWDIPEDVKNNTKISVKIEAVDDNGIAIYATNSTLINVESFVINNNSQTQSIMAVNTMGAMYDVNYQIYNMIDRHPSIPINERKISMPTNYQIVVSRDNVSQLLTFSIDRFFDGVDLSVKACGIKYINANKNEGKAIAVNVSVEENKLTFGWLLDDNVAEKAGTVTFAVEFLGENQFGQLYVWQTTPATFKVEEGLWVDDIVVEERFPTIIEDIQIELKRLELMIENIEITGGGNGRNFTTNPIKLSDPGSEVTGILPITKMDQSNLLTKTNTTAYTPTLNYHPATKKYVDDIILKSAKIINVCDFGAKGDGINDDSMSIRAAIAALTDYSTLYFPPGTYLQGDGTNPNYTFNSGTPTTPEGDPNIGKDISFGFTDLNNIAIVGYGARILAHPNNTCIKNNAGFHFHRCNYLTIVGITYDGNKDRRAPFLYDIYDYNMQNAFSFWGCNDVYAESLNAFNSVMDGFGISGRNFITLELETTISKNVTLHNCHSDNAYRNGITISERSVNYRIIGGSYTNTGKTYGTLPKTGIDLESHSLPVWDNIVLDNSGVIDGCYIANNIADGIGVNQGNTSTVIRNCHFENNGLGYTKDRNAILITSSANNIQIYDNLFRNDGLYANSAGFQIRNNTFEIDSSHNVVILLYGAKTTASIAKYKGNKASFHDNYIHVTGNEVKKEGRYGAVVPWGAVDIYRNTFYNVQAIAASLNTIGILDLTYAEDTAELYIYLNRWVSDLLVAMGDIRTPTAILGQNIIFSNNEINSTVYKIANPNEWDILQGQIPFYQDDNPNIEFDLEEFRDTIVSTSGDKITLFREIGGIPTYFSERDGVDKPILSSGGGEKGDPGYNGWTPVIAIVPDGIRSVMKVVDWTGGEWIKPTIGVYVGETGFVTNISQAINIRGDKGIDGTSGSDGGKGDPGTPGTPGTNGINGWTPIIAIVPDGIRSVMQIVDWTGGEGIRPAIGMYVGETGFVSNIYQGVNIRGDKGADGASGIAEYVYGHISNRALTNAGYTYNLTPIADGGEMSMVSGNNFVAKSAGVHFLTVGGGACDAAATIQVAIRKNSTDAAILSPESLGWTTSIGTSVPNIPSITVTAWLNEGEWMSYSINSSAAQATINAVSTVHKFTFTRVA